MVNAANKPITVSLIAGSTYSQREIWICNQVSKSSRQKIGVLLEGMPSGELLLEQEKNLILERVASGCFCCAGNLVVRVVLNRVIRHCPTHIFIGLSQAEHLSRFRSFLLEPPFQALLHIDSEHVLSS